MSRGRFYVRLESGEWPLLDDLEGAPPFDAAVISDRYLAPYPDGHPQEDEPSDRLADAVDGVNRPFSVDLDTARLQHPASVERQSTRSALRPVARALPLTVEALRSADAVSALVDAAQISQGSRQDTAERCNRPDPSHRDPDFDGQSAQIASQRRPRARSSRAKGRRRRLKGLSGALLHLLPLSWLDP